MVKKSTTGKLLGKRLHRDIFVDFCRPSVTVHRHRKCKSVINILQTICHVSAIFISTLGVPCAIQNFDGKELKNKWWRCTLKQSMQLVHVPLSSWHNAVLGTQLVKVCYYSTTHSSAHSSQGSHVSPALDRLLGLPLQVWLTGLEKDGPPTSSPSHPPQSTLLLLGDV